MDPRYAYVILACLSWLFVDVSYECLQARLRVAQQKSPKWSESTDRLSTARTRVPTGATAVMDIDIGEPEYDDVAILSPQPVTGINTCCWVVHEIENVYVSVCRYG